MPKFAPEEGDHTVQVAQISQHEQRLKVLENFHEEQKASMASLQVLVQEALLQKNCTGTGSYSAAIQNEGLTDQEFPALGTKPSLLRKPITVKLPEEESSTKSDRQNLIQGLETEKDTSEGQQWQQTREQKRRKWRQKLMDKSVIGKREGSRLKSGSKYTDLFIFRVHNDVATEEIKSYLTDEDISVIELKLVSHEQARMKSFKLTIPTKDKEKVMSQEFWEEGIGCREFVQSRLK